MGDSIFEFGDIFDLSNPFQVWEDQDNDQPKNVIVKMLNILFLKQEDVFQIFFSIVSDKEINDAKISLMTVNEKKKGNSC